MNNGSSTSRTTKYSHQYNLQGDVIALLDSGNAIVVEYKYDSWGNARGKAGTLASTLGVLNPFRYRGYVYDEETGLYYLRSRYYNPNTCRFLNTDAAIGDIGDPLSHNLYAYCANNPVIMADEDGLARMWVGEIHLAVQLHIIMSHPEREMMLE